MKTMTQDRSLKLNQLSDFLHQFQAKVIWVDFVSKQRLTKPCASAVIVANRSCFLLRRKS